MQYGGETPPTGPPGMQHSQAGGVRGAIQMRHQNEEILPEYWALMPLIVIAIAIVGSLIGLWWISLIGTILMLILFYKMIKRMDKHSRREAMLRMSLINHFKDFAARDSDVGKMISAQIGTMESINYEAGAREKSLDGILWVILLIIPIVNLFAMLYLLYVFTEFAPEHDRRWHAFTQQVQYAGKEMGMQMVLPSWRVLPNRSFIVYLIVTIVTFGLFGIYWIYVLVKDSNEHVQVQWQFEDQLLRELN